VATQAKLNAIIIGANAGVHNNHNLNPEAGLEAIRMALGGAVTNELANNNIPEDGILNYRANARKNLILATDEDGDLPFHVANRFAGQTTQDPPSPLPAAWQAEVDATAAAVIAAQAFLNLLINDGDLPSASQYGDPDHDVADADLSNWDKAATLANLLADPLTDDSLQTQVLEAGLVARTFDITQVDDANFVANFYAAKAQEIVDDPGVQAPEPTTLAILGLSLAGLGLMRRRRAA
jgi:hypothetical protein